jgi:hypothetical protein
MLVRNLLRRQAVVLIDQRPGPGFERLPVRCTPPVAEPAVTVVPGTLVVEAVADLPAPAQRPARLATGENWNNCSCSDLVRAGFDVGMFPDKLIFWTACYF